MVNLQSINERVILISILIIISVSTLFCFLGIVIPRWGGSSLFEWGREAPAALCIISLLLLIACVAVAAIILSGILQQALLPLIFVLLLIITSIFILGAFTSFVSSPYNHSYNLIVTAFAFTYLSSILATYWLFGARGTNGTTTAPSKQQQQHQDL